MVDIDTFLTILYVQVDTFCKGYVSPCHRPGRAASLYPSEVVTLALFGQWAPFQSERAFYRYAQKHLRPAFPGLPAYSQFNRLLRAHQATLQAFFCHTIGQAVVDRPAYEVLDTFGVATRNKNRRGEGWLWLSCDIGRCSRLGWYEGFHLLSATSPEGVLTGLGFGPASVKEQHLTTTFLALRQQPDARLCAVGKPLAGVYLTDKGFNGYDFQIHWATQWQASVLCPPRRCDPLHWPKGWHRRLSGLRQIAESLHAKLLNTFRLATERPHSLAGFWCRLMAKAALHNFCIWLNRQVGRPLLAFADLIDW
jgi:hypothetical protein